MVCGKDAAGLMIVYGIVKDTYFLGKSIRVSWGIAAYADSIYDDTAAVVASVHNVTSDRNQIAELVQMCNRLQLSPVQLNDVIEDFISN